MFLDSEFKIRQTANGIGAPLFFLSPSPFSVKCACPMIPLAAGTHFQPVPHVTFICHPVVAYLEALIEFNIVPVAYDLSIIENDSGLFFHGFNDMGIPL